MILSLISLLSCLRWVSRAVIRLCKLLAGCSIIFYSALENKLIHNVAQLNLSRDSF